MKHINIAILTPGHSLMGEYVKSLLDTITLLNKEGLSWGFFNSYASHVADARETTLSNTTENNIYETRPFNGEATYDKLMWIDSDIAWNPEDVLKLYYSDKDIVTGAYLLQNGTVAAYEKFLGAPYIYEQVMAMTEPVKVKGAGFGFICVKYGIFEHMSRPWFQSVEKEIEINGTKLNMSVIGEDLSWCARATDLGHDIWLDPSIKVTHHKMMKLTWEGIKF